MDPVPLVYAGVLIACVVVVTGTVLARRASTGPYAEGGAADLLDAAFLSGGPGRVADTVICRMYTDGRLAVGGPGLVSVQQPVATHPVEQALLEVYATAPHGALKTLRGALMRRPEIQLIGDRLADRGLMLRPARLRLWRNLAAYLSLGSWLTAFVVIVTADADTGVSTVFKIIPVVILGFIVGATCRGAAGKRITADGRRALETYHRQTAYTPPPRPSRWRRRAPAPVLDAAAVVALSGAFALYDDPLRDHLLAAQRTAGATSSGTSSAGSDPGSGDSGGSWCGGGSGSGCGGSSCGGSSCGGGSGCGGGGGSSCGGGGGGCGGGGG